MSGWQGTKEGDNGERPLTGMWFLLGKEMFQNEEVVMAVRH